MKCDSTQIFWEEFAKNVGKDYSPVYTTIVSKDKQWADCTDKMEKKHQFRIVNLGESMIVLDIGCGTDRWAFEFANKVNDVVLIEFFPTFIQLAQNIAKEKEIKNISFICKSITDFSYLENKSFNITHLDSISQYLEDETVEKLIVKIKNHLKSDGLILVKDTIALNKRFSKIANFRCVCRTENEFINIFVSKGFKLIYVNENYFTPALELYRKFPNSVKKLIFPIFNVIDSILLNQKVFYRLLKKNSAHRFHFFKCKEDDRNKKSVLY